MAAAEGSDRCTGHTTRSTFFCCAVVELARSNTWRFVIPKSLVGGPISDKGCARYRPIGERPHANTGRAIK